jgi:hypothetical protein
MQLSFQNNHNNNNSSETEQKILNTQNKMQRKEIRIRSSLPLVHVVVFRKKGGNKKVKSVTREDLTMY